MSNKPEQTFKVGPVRASVFQNQIIHNGRPVSLPKVVAVPQERRTVIVRYTAAPKGDG